MYNLIIINELLKFFKQIKSLKINTIRHLLRINYKNVNKSTIFSSFFVAFSMRFLILISVIGFQSCLNWTPSEEKVVARVGNVYLYASDVNNEITSFSDTNDSLLKTRNFIDTWAKSQLLVQLAETNLADKKIQSLEKLINQYRLELYTNSYIQSVVNSTLESEISNKEIDSFIMKNDGVFKLNAPLFQTRYIHLPPDNVDQREIQRSFERFNSFDQHFLDSLSFQYYNFNLADSLWLNKRELLSEVSFLNTDNADKYLKKSQLFRVEDSLGVYLFYVNDLLEKGETAPRIILEATIKNIIRNQRKLKFKKEFEKDLIQDAIKSKTYEIY